MDARTNERTPDTPGVGVMGLDVPPERHSLAMSPINRRRWENFKANRRGYWAFWVFMVLFVVTLFAEFLANDQPFYSRWKGNPSFRGFFPIPEPALAASSRPRPAIAIRTCASSSPARAGPC